MDPQLVQWTFLAELQLPAWERDRHQHLRNRSGYHLAPHGWLINQALFSWQQKSLGGLGETIREVQLALARSGVGAGSARATQLEGCPGEQVQIFFFGMSLIPCVVICGEGFNQVILPPFAERSRPGKYSSRNA